MEDPQFRRDLYKGTAADYEQFRPRYPASLLSDLLARTRLEPGGRLLDVACGTGQIAFDLAGRFAEVWAIDQEPETIEFATRNAARRNVTNIEFRVADAEEFSTEGERFDLVAIGNAFHRVRRRDVARAARGWLRPGGFFALLWGGTPNVPPGSVGLLEAEWQVVLAELMKKWMSALGEERVPSTFQAALEAASNESILEAAGFEVLGHWDFLEPYEWSVETLVGYLYSTSVLSRSFVGERSAEFEADVRDALLAAAPSGVFRQDLSFGYELARSR
jgi:ubiquinone/menaquinone biosynthesis C-methylase UbiE